jgi:MFS transporter, DHA3 family, tetracycline resistance protein
MRRPLPAPVVYLTMEACWGAFFYLMATISSVYRIREAGLDPLQLVLVGTVLEGTTLLFEVPTGVVADTVSRRTSIVVGTFLVGVGWMLEGAVAEFPAILVAQVLWGIGFTFTSGADVAWITDEVGEERAARLYLVATQVGQLAALAGIAGSVALATRSLGTPIFVGGACAVGLGLFLAATMPERGWTRPPRGGRRLRPRSFAATFRGGVATVRGRPLLLMLLAASALHGMSTEGFDRLWALQLLEATTLPPLGRLDRIVWFGVIQAGGLVLAVLAAEGVKRRVDVTTDRGAAGALAVVSALLVATVVGFAYATGFVPAVAALWGVTALRGLNEPLYAAWLNRGLDPATRATVNSMGSQADAFGQVAGGPVLGVLAVARSTRAAIVAAGLVRAPATLLFARAGMRTEPGAR